jgi:hypothetical protein
MMRNYLVGGCTSGFINIFKINIVLEDKRGWPAGKAKKDYFLIRHFINSYDLHVSHFTRRNNKETRYFPASLTKTKLYEQFKRKYPDRTDITFDQFNYVLNKYYSDCKFEQPKLDACTFCVKIHNLKSAPTLTAKQKASLEELLKKHHEEADKRYELYTEDIKREKPQVEVTINHMPEEEEEELEKEIRTTQEWIIEAILDKKYSFNGDEMYQVKWYTIYI